MTVSDLLLAQQLLAACGGYAEAKAAAIELNNQADEIERLTAECHEYRDALRGMCTCAQFGPMTVCPACKTLRDFRGE